MKSGYYVFVSNENGQRKLHITICKPTAIDQAKIAQILIEAGFQMDGHSPIGYTESADTVEYVQYTSNNGLSRVLRKLNEMV